MSSAGDTTRSTVVTATGLALPDGLVRQLDGFRATVRRVKAIEAIAGALFGVLVAWLALFLLDRLTETPAAARWVLFAAAAIACGAIPLALHRWFWGLRGTKRLARLVARRFPSLGDQLLGVIELVQSQGEQHRSRVLCEAAIGQVAAATGRHDLRAAVPRPRHRLWAGLAAAPLLLALATALAVPTAAANAWQRLLGPWRSIERHTFARIEPLPDPLVVPHGEPVAVPVRLVPDSPWQPERATARLDGGGTLRAERDGETYSLPLPPQVSERRLRLAVGDARGKVTVVPTHRPEIASLTAVVTLPDYLGIVGASSRELRGGGLSVVKGSRVVVRAAADRDLASATVDGASVETEGEAFEGRDVLVEEPVSLALAWKDTLGLDGAKPLTVKLVPRDDEPPSIVVDGLSGRAVLLDTETVRFTLQARDDFGIETAGIEWLGDGGGKADEARGEAILGTGGPEVAALDVVGTFTPAALGIAPQTVTVRAWVEDRLPGRGRVRSAPATFVVMNSADHALWVNEQISRWRQQAAEVRDKELELLSRNEELRALADEELDSPENRRAIRDQAAAERGNARRLGKLAQGGAELVRQAMRNPEFEADALDELAEHVAAMEEMAATRMPDLASLLKAASEAPAGGSGQPRQAKPARDGAPPKPSEGSREGEAPRTAGEDRRPPGAPKPGQQGRQGLPPAPQVVDGESSLAGQAPQGDPQDAKEPGGPAPANPGRLGLPTTTIAGTPSGGGGAPPGGPQAEVLDEVLEKQRQLIEDFARIARQLNDVMARLEGTTFVKRLKAASRNEAKVGEGLSGVVAGAFGRRRGDDDGAIERKIAQAGRGNDDVSGKMSVLMDDLDAYFERRPQPAIRTVLEDMKELDVLSNLRTLSDRMKEETGLAIARSEFWSDTFDRWADELVPPPRPPGPGSSGPPRESLPPEVVLEAMKILEAETILRDDTRVAEQVRRVSGAGPHAEKATALAATQAEIAARTVGLADRLADIPPPVARFADEVERMRRGLPPETGADRFGDEIALFRKVATVMTEARGILGLPDTGRRAIAAETEAIELLLQSKSCGGGGGGGGGTSPGRGGTGSTRDRALARLGRGINAQARLEAPEEEQAVGRSGRVLPDEFRDGLDAYFNALERARGGERRTP